METHGTVGRESVRRTGPALAPIRMSKSRFNVTLRDGQSVGLQVEAIPQEGVTGCGTKDIEYHQFINTRQTFFLKRKSALYILAICQLIYIK
jgi:hypothetical protein